jgi:hypothetical protein
VPANAASFNQASTTSRTVPHPAFVSRDLVEPSCIPVEGDHGFRGKLITESGDRDQPGEVV